LKTGNPSIKEISLKRLLAFGLNYLEKKYLNHFLVENSFKKLFRQTVAKNKKKIFTSVLFRNDKIRNRKEKPKSTKQIIIIN